MERIIKRKRGSSAQSDGISLAAFTFFDRRILKASCLALKHRVCKSDL